MKQKDIFIRMADQGRSLHHFFLSLGYHFAALQVEKELGMFSMNFEGRLKKLFLFLVKSFSDGKWHKRGNTSQEHRMTQMWPTNARKGCSVSPAWSVTLTDRCVWTVCQWFRPGAAWFHDWWGRGPTDPCLEMGLKTTQQARRFKSLKL